MNSNVWPFAAFLQGSTVTVPPCGRLSPKPSRTIRNYLDLKAKEALLIKDMIGFITVRVYIFNILPLTVSYKSICSVTTSTAKYAKHR